MVGVCALHGVRALVDVVATNLGIFPTLFFAVYFLARKGFNLLDAFLIHEKIRIGMGSTYTVNKWPLNLMYFMREGLQSNAVCKWQQVENYLVGLDKLIICSIQSLLY